ncbi:MAG: hypothetical protein P1U68_06980 [Verrucomicrobiales bacterium]|nr:hypothetical protein [Verrucomicrobiales bacterium]
MILSAVVLIGQTLPVRVDADEPPAGPAVGGKGDPRGGEREKWESLSEEDREKLKVALRDVWADPSVLSAREEVKLASEAYQKAIRSAISKADPSLIGLLKEIQDMNEGNMRDRLKGSGPGRFPSKRGLEYPAGPPAFLEKLTGEEREMFRAAEEKAQESESVRAAKKQLDQIRAQDDQLRKRRMEAHLKMRRAVLEAMFKDNPELKSLQSRLDFKPGAGGKGRPGGKKAGPGEKGRD